MNTKIGTPFWLTLFMVLGVVATMLALGTFGLGKASAAAPSPQTMTASPGSPGDTSSIKIAFETDETIAGNTGEIWVAFDAKYGIPTTIAKTSISIASGQTTGGVSNPLIDPTVAVQIAASSPLSVSDSVVKLQLGDTAPNSTGTVEGLYVNVDQTDHTITFATSAGITLPTLASTQGIWLSKDQGTTWSVTAITADTNGITVVRELTLSATSGARGKVVTATGKGFTGTGNATLWVDTDDGGDIDTSDYVIASDIAVSGGSFEYEFTSDTNFPLTATAINAQGGDGLAVSTSTNPTFDSYGAITLDKTEVARGAALKITSVDWLASTIASIKIGGVTQTLPSDVTIAADVDEGFSITVAATTPLGSQKIIMASTSGGEHTTGRYTTVTITGAPVTVSPSTAVANEEVTITGTGFTKSSNLTSITVGGQDVTYTSSGGINNTTTIAADVDTDSSGNFSVSFLIPDSATTRTAGSHKILVTDDGSLTGEVFVTVPGRTISLSTDSSKRSSEVTVTGSGYEAKGNVVLEYLSGTTTTSLGSATADAFGDFEKVVTIPNTPSIPSTNTITGAISSGGTKTATHKIPESAISIDVSEQSAGDNVTITGTGFPAYATVATMTIGGLDVRPTPAPSTDIDGGFTSTVMVPGLTVGNHNVSVTASSVTGSVSLKVLAAVVVVPEVVVPEVIAASTVTSDVFADSIASGNLVRIWQYANETQEWSFFDPAEGFADANTLLNAEPGDILWVNVTLEETFEHTQGSTLFAGWNQIVLN